MIFTRRATDATTVGRASCWALLELPQTRPNSTDGDRIAARSKGPSICGIPIEAVKNGGSDVRDRPPFRGLRHPGFGRRRACGGHLAVVTVQGAALRAGAAPGPGGASEPAGRASPTPTRRHSSPHAGRIGTPAGAARRVRRRPCRQGGDHDATRRQRGLGRLSIGANAEGERRPSHPIRALPARQRAGAWPRRGVDPRHPFYLVARPSEGYWPGRMRVARLKVDVLSISANC